MRIALYIIAGLIGAGLLVWLFIIIFKKPSDPGSYDSIPRPVGPNGDTTVTPQPTAYKSLLVKEGDIAVAVDPANYFSQLNDVNTNSHNVHVTPQTAIPLIHFVTSFNKTCPPYIWYKYVLYSYVNTKTDEQGNKTCYYKFDKSVLPARLEIRSTTPPFKCSQFKYYLSGVEYRYKETKTIPNLTGTQYFCIYEK